VFFFFPEKDDGIHPFFWRHFAKIMIFSQKKKTPPPLWCEAKNKPSTFCTHNINPSRRHIYKYFSIGVFLEIYIIQYIFTEYSQMNEIALKKHT